MRGALVLLALAAVALAPAQRTPNGRFEFKYQAVDDGLNREPRLFRNTAYSLYDHHGGFELERWKVTLPESPIHSWVTNDGIVWVLADAAGDLRGGPNFSRLKLWSRSLDAELKGSWDRSLFLNKMTLPADKSPVEAIDLEKSGPRNLGMSGNEQFVVAMKDGSEVHVDLVRTLNAGTVKLIQSFGKGQSAQDPLENLLTSGGEPIDVKYPLPGKAPFAIWTAAGGNRDVVLETFDELNYGDGTTRLVKSARKIPVAPQYVVPTCFARFAWFDFPNGQEAFLRLVTRDGVELQSVDLVKLGKFSGSEAVKRKLVYRGISALGPYGLTQLGDDFVGNIAGPDKLWMSDRNGKQYVVTFTSDAANHWSASTVASLGLDRIAKKEPVYPGIKVVSETTEASPGGAFKLRTKQYEVDGHPLSQLTLIARLKDPIEGDKEVELWSAPYPLALLATRVSDTGRAYAVTHLKQDAKPDQAKREFVMLTGWEINGKPFGSYDFADYCLKWFPTEQDALKEVDLSKVKFGLEDQLPDQEIEGLPFPAWDYERLDFPFANGQTKSLYVHRQAENMTIVLLRKPK
jgi:hypothetical protein